MKITIISESSWGYKDQELSINVPEDRELCEIINDKDIPSFSERCRIDPRVEKVNDGPGYFKVALPKKPKATIFDEYLSYFKEVFDKESKVTVFDEYLGYTCQRINGYLMRSFPAVEIYPFYMLWAEERGEWVGIKFHYLGCDTEVDGNTECIETAGPFKLNRKCAELIKQAYRSKIPVEKILHTHPSELEGEISQK